MNDSNYPWLIAVPRVPKVSEVYQLDLTDQTQLNAESTLLGALLMQWFSGQKLNVAALGNVVPQLHIHHIVTFKKY